MAEGAPGDGRVMPKQADALAVREAALVMLRARGINRIVRDLGMCVTYSGDGLGITFRNQFQSRARPHSRWVIEAAINGVKVQPAMPYGVSVVIDGLGKVFDIGFDDREQHHIVCFKRGPWEAMLKDLAATCLSVDGVKQEGNTITAE